MRIKLGEKSVDIYHWPSVQDSTVGKEGTKRKVGTGMGRGHLRDGTAQG